MEVKDLYHPKFGVVSDLIEVLYGTDGCETGGLCHIVTDDSSLYDDCLDFVINSCQKEENKDRIDKELSFAICTILNQMTFQQRALLFDMQKCGFKYFTLEDIQYFFDKFRNGGIDNFDELLEEYDFRHTFVKEKEE